MAAVRVGQCHVLTRAMTPLLFRSPLRQDGRVALNLATAEDVRALLRGLVDPRADELDRVRAPSMRSLGTRPGPRGKPSAPRDIRSTDSEEMNPSEDRSDTLSMRTGCGSSCDSAVVSLLEQLGLDALIPIFISVRPVSICSVLREQ